MFKIIMLVKKKPELDTEAFIARWQQHSEKVLGLKDVLNIRHYAKTLPFQAGAQPATQRGTLPFAFDAMGELWYDSRNDFAPAEPKQGRRHWPHCARMKPSSWICSIPSCGLAKKSA